GDGGPDRRLLPRGLRAALPAAADGPRLRLPGGQRRGAAALALLAAPVAAAVRRASQGAPGLRARQLRGAPNHALARLRARPPARSGHRPLRPQPRALGPGGGARPRPLPRADAGRDDGADLVPDDRRAALPAHLRTARLLLVPPPGRGCGCVTRRR